MIPITPRESKQKIHFNTSETFSNPGQTEKLEATVCEYHDCRFAVAFHSPQNAAAAALVAIGVRKGGRIVTGAMGPDYHYAAIAMTGAMPAFCEIDLNGNLNNRALLSMASGSKCALLLNRFEGIHSSLPDLPETATVIEDASASLSPAPVYHLTLWSIEALMPEGISPTGFALTNDFEVAERVRRYRDGGREHRSKWNYDIAFPSIDAGLCELEASIALQRMEHLLPARIARLKNIERLDNAFSGNRLADRIKRADNEDMRTYPLLLTPPLYCPKEDIYDTIRKNGVEVNVCCKPVYKTTAYKDESVRLPVTEDFYKALLQLPCHHLLSKEEIERVCETVLKALDTFGYRGCRF